MRLTVDRARRALRLVPWPLAAVVAVGAWAVPAALSAAHGAESISNVGETWTRTWPATSNRTEAKVWEFTFDLAGPEDAFRVLPQVILFVEYSGGARAGAGELGFHQSTYVNGVESFRGVMGHNVVPQESGMGFSAGPGGAPGAYEEFDQSAFQAGRNHVRVELEVLLRVSQSGTGVFRWTAGPAELRVADHDGNHDGVYERFAPLPGIHSGITGLVAGVVVGVAGTAIVRRFVAKRDKPSS